MTSAVEVAAHRGWSGRHPESTRAAYRAAVGLARTSGRALVLECDVRPCADGELVVLHDPTLARTGGRPDAVADLTLAELRRVDLGSWWTDRPEEDERALVTLDELLELVAAARAEGVEVGLAVETKHDGPGGLEVDRQVVRRLAAHGWTGPDAPVRVISFEPDAVELVGELAPGLRRTLLVGDGPGRWAGGVLPPGVGTVGLDAGLAAHEPAWVDLLLGRGHAVHVWTVDDAAELARWLDRGITGLTSNHPDRALAAVHGAS